MTSTEFRSTLHNVTKTIFWSGVPDQNKRVTIKQIQKLYKFRFLSDNELTEAINKLKQFDINLLWDKQFWGLKKHESICAIANEPYQSLKRIKSTY
jgi:hypothetical protein